MIAREHRHVRQYEFSSRLARCRLQYPKARGRHVSLIVHGNMTDGPALISSLTALRAVAGPIPRLLRMAWMPAREIVFVSSDAARRTSNAARAVAETRFAFRSAKNARLITK